jgi:hypothetical protein
MDFAEPRIMRVVMRAGSSLLIEPTKGGGRAARQKNIIMTSFRSHNQERLLAIASNNLPD